MGASSLLADNIQKFRYCEPMDVVYTWVNGSDAQFIEAIKLHNPNYDVSRFDDKNELRYSLRSLEKYAPWVRHVYIVTNGQIPNWLDLSYAKVTIVPHAYLVDALQLDILPTFSSATIETFLHRIPSLSERFLYLNDDIFLNAPLYPEDLYTQSEGVRVYQAWMVPDCAPDCPWTYIADGACDAHCNIAACQFDGNDCDEPILKQHTKSSFKEILRHQNTTGYSELQQIALNFNQLRLGKVATTTTTAKPIIHMKNQSNKHSSTDIYSQSLIHTNMLLNQVYGFKARNVLAHVGFLLQRSIITDMQEKFKEAVLATSRHKFRAADDLQFAFVYFTFLMSETRQADVAEIFDEYDTDNSGTWSDREVRTLLARMYPLPLDWSAMHYFEEVMGNCSQAFATTKNIVYPTLVYERYEDSNLPTITKHLVEHCAVLADALKSNFGKRAKYKYNINARRNSHNNFMMLTSNVTEVVDELDKLRVHAKKFNCINDNLDPQQEENNALIRQLLEDFYLSFFPAPSRFELATQYRNRFNNWQDYSTWRRRKRAAIAIGYTAAILLMAFVARFLCLHKAKIVRRCVQKL